MPDDPGSDEQPKRVRIDLAQLVQHASRVRAGEAAGGQAAAGEGSSNLAELVRRLDRLEVYAEQAGLQAQLVSSVNEYVKSLKAEVDALYWIRIGAIAFAGLFVATLCAGATLAFIYEPGWLADPRNHAVPAILTAAVGASVALIAIVLKGVFRAIADRNKDELLPEHLKAALDTVKMVSEAVGK